MKSSWRSSRSTATTSMTMRMVSVHSASPANGAEHEAAACASVGASVARSTADPDTITVYTTIAAYIEPRRAGTHDVGRVRRHAGDVVVMSACAACGTPFRPHAYAEPLLCACCNERDANPPPWPLGACPRNLEPRPVACICIVGSPE